MIEPLDLSAIQPFDLSTAGSVASVASLILGFAGGLWWRRVRKLIARDRESTVGLLGLFEVYRHLQRAEAALGELVVGRSSRGGGQRTDLSRPQRREMQTARDGIIRSQQALNVFFGSHYELKIAGSDPLVRAARYHRLRGPLVTSMTFYEQALAFSDDGRTLCPEDRRACIEGLQYCAVMLNEREEAARWAREAAARGIEGCIAEQALLKWFVVYRLAFMLRLLVPTLSGRRGSGEHRIGPPGAAA